MKLDVEVNEVILSNVGQLGEFKIRNSAKAFKILSDGLYSNKIRAIIRELSCNAVDSHVAAGKADIPFEVHLPTVFEPWFAVRDFGTGLSGDQVTNIYTTYFESTKTDSNDFIGALGLGSKSPFSYTENFTVTAIKDGVKRIYSAFINDVGVPSIAQMDESNIVDNADDLPLSNGVEVKFSVSDKSDYYAFRREAIEVFRWFKVKPTITGNNDFVIASPTYQEMNIVPGVHTLTNSRYNSDSHALMGNICYPLNNIPNEEKYLGNLSALLHCGLVIEFGIGELDFAASREQLSYVPLTLNSIKKRLETLNANLVTHIKSKVNEIDNKWDKAAYLYEQVQMPLYKSAVVKFVAETKFELFDAKDYRGRTTFIYDVKDLEKRGLNITGARCTPATTSTISSTREYVNTGYITTMHIPVDSDVIIVLNDLKTGCLARARYHYKNHNDLKTTTIFCISHTDPDLDVRQAEYDKILKEMHNPPRVVKASTLQKPATKARVSSSGIMRLVKKTGKFGGSADSYMWIPYVGEIDEDAIYHFVYLNNFKAEDKTGTEIPILTLKSWIDSSNIDELTSIEIYGVRKLRKKEIDELDNWVWIEDKLKQETSKISDKHIASLVIAEMLDSYYERIYTSNNVARLVGKDSDYSKYVNEYGTIARINGNVPALVALCSRYGKSVEVDAVKKKIEDTKVHLYKKYRLLKYLTNATIDEVDMAHYIKLIDKQEKINE